MIPLQRSPVWLHALFFLLLQCAATLCSCPQRCYCTLRTATCTSPSFPLILPSGILKLQITGTVANLPNNSVILPEGEQLKSMTVRSASIGDIKPEAFSGHQLNEMIFKQVAIGRIWGNAFTNCAIQTIYIRKSTIEVVSKEAFSGLTSETIQMLLTNITTIETEAFKSATLSEAVSISFGHLNDVKAYAFNLSSPLILSMITFDHFGVDPSTFVIFSYNRLNCTCESAWLWSSKYDYSDDLSYNKCISPAPLKNVYLDDVNPSTLCPTKNTWEDVYDANRLCNRWGTFFCGCKRHQHWTFCWI